MSRVSPARSATRGRRTRDSALTKESILRAATFEFCRNGLGGARVEAIAFDVLDDGLSPHPGTDVDQRKLVSAIDQVDVAVVGVGEVEAVAARSDEVDALRQPHGLRKLKL